MDMIILAGMPATGKSTAAGFLRSAFGYPVLEKDAIKEALFDTVGFEGYPAKRMLDVAANEVLLRLIRGMIEADTSVIVDNNFDEASAGQLKKILSGAPVSYVTVFLEGDPDVLYARYVERDAKKLRHLGHAMQTNYPPHPGESTEFHMSREGFNERFIDRKMNAMSWGGPVIRIDTTVPENLDPKKLCCEIARLLKEGK